MKYVLVSACLLGLNCRYDGKNNYCPAVAQLLNRDDICLIPVCPEQMGGLPTPRIPSECSGSKVISKLGADVSVNFRRGAEFALKIANLYGCRWAILKERSPSCGHGKIYDGTFSKHLVSGYGKTAELLSENGLKILGETDLQSDSVTFT